MENVQISVIIPAYNTEKYIAECLESVFLQRDVIVEIICINDGSTDATLQIVNGYKENGSLVIYSQDNRGLSAVRNLGVELAKGKYIYFLDSDDKLADEYVLRDLFVEAEKDNVDFIEFDAKAFFETDELSAKSSDYKTMYRRRKSYGLYERGVELFAELYQQKEYYCSSCLRLYRRDFLQNKKIRFLEGILYEDNLHTLICYIKAGRVKHVERTVMLRRVREGSITQQKMSYKNFISYVKMYLHLVWLLQEEETEIISEQLKALCDGTRQNMIMAYHQLDEAEKRKANEDNLAGYLMKKYLAREDSLEEFSFPYHLFHMREKVMIYGAGRVGKCFYRIAKRDGVVEVEGIIDRRGEILSEEDICVCGLDEIKGKVEFVWLIAIENPMVAQDAKRVLMCNGVSQEKILWDGEKYKTHGIAIQKWMDSRAFLEFNAKEKHTPRIFVFMQPEHGNLGDYAISLGEEKFFKLFFPEHDTVWVTYSQWSSLKDVFLSAVSEEDIVFLNGGGYIGNLWKSWMQAKEILASFPDNTKILFPNTLSYTQKATSENVAYQEDVAWIKSCPHLHIFFRDRYSEMLMHNSGVQNVYFFPDMALFMDVNVSTKRTQGSKILLCFRNDSEKIVKNDEALERRLLEMGFDVERKDIHMDRYLSLQEGREYVPQFISELEGYRLVITDRLHAMLFAALTNVPCIAFDNLTGKVAGVRDWVCHRKIKMVSQIDEIDEALIHSLEVKTVDNELELDEEFEKMAKFIRDIWNIY